MKLYFMLLYYSGNTVPIGFNQQTVYTVLLIYNSSVGLDHSSSATNVWFTQFTNKAQKG